MNAAYIGIRNLPYRSGNSLIARDFANPCPVGAAGLAADSELPADHRDGCVVDELLEIICAL
jgi:hypothetical protein